MNWIELELKENELNWNWIERFWIRFELELNWIEKSWIQLELELNWIERNELIWALHYTRGFTVAAHDQNKDGTMEYNDFSTGRKRISKQYLMSAFGDKKKKKKGGKKGKKGKTKITRPIPNGIPTHESDRPWAEGEGPPKVCVAQHIHYTDTKRFDRNTPPKDPLQVSGVGDNSLCPCDATWCQRSWSTLVQVMACGLTAPSHCLNQCWVTLVESCEIHLKLIFSKYSRYHWYEFEN